LAILLAPVTQVASDHAPQLYSKGGKVSFISVGNYCGTSESKAIDISHLSFGAAYYLTDGLAAFFALRWHFLRTKNWNVYLNHGIGPLLFFIEMRHF